MDSEELKQRICILEHELECARDEILELKSFIKTIHKHFQQYTRKKEF